MTVVVALIAAVLVGAAAVALVRVVRGPSVLDRAIATEVLISTLVCALGLEAAITRHSATLPILISLSLVGFVGSVAVARFVGRDRDEPLPSQQADRRDRPGPDRSEPWGADEAGGR
ncbi:MAG TPA: monovalent cation/H+ antiporter complex subunit F [Segeticoccus sp.]|jgi:multicomponent Na+:H+ antiporter subunit F|nr:monovalent cation/H+ antiporter complex subunit F [Segeticoccus sp.]